MEPRKTKSAKKMCWATKKRLMISCSFWGSTRLVPIFWCLLNEEKHVGVTVHYIDEGIDSGPIIYRRKIKVTRLDTEDTLYWKCVREGENLLEAAILDISKKRVKTLTNLGGKYYSFPTSKAVNRFRAKGKSFVNFKDYLC